MEVAGVVFRQAPCFFSSSNSFSTMKQSRSFCPKQSSNRKSVAALAFSDKSHLEYYNGAMKESKKKETKKKLKVLKGLSKKLSAFSDMGFGLNSDNGLDHQVKGQMISEATEVLLGQLQKIKAERLELKRKKKAKKMMTGCKDSSSSSSSSSDCECDDVMKTSQLIKTMAAPNVHEEARSSPDHNNASCNKIEVCMGGKCKKSGGGMLLENFEKAVGGEAAVVGCKCMGKCRDGPNVRVRNNGDAAVCMGVGLEDVDLIVTNLFGGSSLCDMVPGPALLSV